MESQFGIAHVWAQGDFVSRSVAILLLLMSVASWAVIIIKALALVKMKKYARKAEGFWHSEDFAVAQNKLGTEADNPFRNMALEGREAVASGVEGGAGATRLARLNDLARPCCCHVRHSALRRRTLRSWRHRAGRCPGDAIQRVDRRLEFRHPPRCCKPLGGYATEGGRSAVRL